MFITTFIERVEQKYIMRASGNQSDLQFIYYTCDQSITDLQETIIIDVYSYTLFNIVYDIKLIIN